MKLAKLLIVGCIVSLGLSQEAIGQQNGARLGLGIGAYTFPIDQTVGQKIIVLGRFRPYPVELRVQSLFSAGLSRLEHIKMILSVNVFKELRLFNPPLPSGETAPVLSIKASWWILGKTGAHASAGTAVDAKGNRTGVFLDSITLVVRKEGDANGDGSVDYGDFWVLLAFYGSSNLTEDGYEKGDFDLDGDVDFGDFLILSANFGT